VFRLGFWEISIIVAMILIIFGPKRLPELGRGIAQFFTNFKSGLKEEPKEKPHLEDTHKSE
jgi:sec-independent protein translocase protein TatA